LGREHREMGGIAKYGVHTNVYFKRQHPSKCLVAGKDNPNEPYLATPKVQQLFRHKA
jgi:hypothetical protein